MKKLLIVFFCIFICFTFTGCSLFYEYKADAINHFDIGYSKVLNDSFVAAFNWDGSEEDKDVVIPEKFNGTKITSLGGYCGRGVPSPFGINISQTKLNDLCGDVKQWFVSSSYEQIQDIDKLYLNFNIHISKNIEEIKIHNCDSFYIGENKDSKIIVFILYNVTCDENNKIFYAKDGKLYYRQNDELVSDILYFDHNFED